MATNPDWRPMRRTMPTPRWALEASTLAARMARWASSTAVSNPNVLSMTRMSLSIDLGTATTEHTTPARRHSMSMALAAALPLRAGDGAAPSRPAGSQVASTCESCDEGAPWAARLLTRCPRARTAC